MLSIVRHADKNNISALWLSQMKVLLKNWKPIKPKELFIKKNGVILKRYVRSALSLIGQDEVGKKYWRQMKRRATAPIWINKGG